jgi:hypothetical protein
MAGIDEIRRLIDALPGAERERLLQELRSTPRGALPQLGNVTARQPSPHSVAWLKSERGHAVLATDTGPQEADLPAGADAIRGMWADMQEVAG